eukprot:420304-Alexandrium_andersonii.AAC.1
MSASLVGSEMCIRDRIYTSLKLLADTDQAWAPALLELLKFAVPSDDGIEWLLRNNKRDLSRIQNLKEEMDQSAAFVGAAGPSTSAASPSTARAKSKDPARAQRAQLVRCCACHV